MKSEIEKLGTDVQASITDIEDAFTSCGERSILYKYFHSMETIEKISTELDSYIDRETYTNQTFFFDLCTRDWPNMDSDSHVTLNGVILFRDIYIKINLRYYIKTTS